jgi:hypothetical protein
MKRATRRLQSLAILLFLPLMAHAQFENEHAFLWTQAGGMQDLGTNRTLADQHRLRDQRCWRGRWKLDDSVGVSQKSTLPRLLLWSRGRACRLLLIG